MASVEAALARLAKSNERVAKADAAREAAMRARDADVRAAQDAGATYEAIKAKTGLSSATIAKAAGRK